MDINITNYLHIPDWQYLTTELGNLHSKFAGLFAFTCCCLRESAEAFLLKWASDAGRWDLLNHA